MSIFKEYLALWLFDELCVQSVFFLLLRHSLFGRSVLFSFVLCVRALFFLKCSSSDLFGFWWGKKLERYRHTASRRRRSSVVFSFHIQLILWHLFWAIHLLLFVVVVEHNLKCNYDWFVWIVDCQHYTFTFGMTVMASSWWCKWKWYSSVNVFHVARILNKLSDFVFVSVFIYLFFVVTLFLLRTK